LVVAASGVPSGQEGEAAKEYAMAAVVLDDIDDNDCDDAMDGDYEDDDGGVDGDSAMDDNDDDNDGDDCDRRQR